MEDFLQRNSCFQDQIQAGVQENHVRFKRFQNIFSSIKESSTKNNNPQCEIEIDPIKQNCVN